MTYRQDPVAHALLVVAFNGVMFGLEVATGREVWRVVVGGTGVRVVLDGDRAYAASLDALWCVEVASGVVVWHVATRYSGRGALVLQGGRLFVGRLGELECFSTAGDKLWEAPFKGLGYGEMALGFPGNFVQADEGR